MAEMVLAEMDSFGARVRIVSDGRMISTTTEGVPEWVRVSRDLMAARCREYEQETGHWPDMTLLERFSAVMGKRLEDFIRDPKGHPWKPMGLRQFEMEGANADADDQTKMV